MNTATFYKQTLLIVLFCAGALLLANLVPIFKAHQLLSWISLAVYTGLSLLIYFLGETTTKSKDKNAFIQIMLIFIFLKMMLSFAMVVLYAQNVEPASKYFILPFLFIYLVFTIFETAFLMRIAKPPSSVS